MAREALNPNSKYAPYMAALPMATDPYHTISYETFPVEYLPLMASPLMVGARVICEGGSRDGWGRRGRQVARTISLWGGVLSLVVSVDKLA